MKLSDYVAQFLAEQGITHVFGMSGGAVIHIFDSIDKRSDIKNVFMTHEQAASIAADGYSRATGKLGVAVSTSGPGATNLLTGTCCSYYDSIPTLMLTGQVASHRIKGSLKVRQLGFQETDVISIFKSITKYAVQLKKSSDIKKVLQEAIFFAFDGRQGPVLIDIPDDLQREDINPIDLIEFYPEKKPKKIDFPIEEHIQSMLDMIKKSNRPVLVIGGGIKTPVVMDKLINLVEHLNIPVLLTWAALDFLPFNHPLRVGTFGIYGSRAGNLTIQNSDLLITLGARLSQNHTGGILKSFARQAKIVMIDIDNSEMNKFDRTEIKIDLKINSSISKFIIIFNTHFLGEKLEDWDFWKENISHWKKILLQESSPSPAKTNSYVDANDLVVGLSNHLRSDAIIFTDTGGNLTWTCNSFRPKAGQSLHSSWNNTPMGYSLPASIGASINNPTNDITCIIGDGGLLLCLGELATVIYHKLPIKIFLFNNHCHGIQKQTLETWLSGRMVGINSSSGLSLPFNWEDLANSFGFSVYTINSLDKLNNQLDDIYSLSGPVFINVEINPEQKLYPILKHGSPLENQLPELDINQEMIVPLFKN